MPSILETVEANEKRESDLLKAIPFLRFFNYGHLPGHLHKVVSPYRDLAYQIAERGGDPAERQVALRKLCESKDCAVRALIPIEPE